MDYLKELAARTNLSASWQSWTPEYRVLAIAVALVLAYWALRSALPAFLRVLKPALFLVFVFGAVWALFPEATCSLEPIAKLPVICSR